MSANELSGPSEVTSMSPPYSVPPAQRCGGVRASYGLISEDRLFGVPINVPAPRTHPAPCPLCIHDDDEKGEALTRAPLAHIQRNQMS
jgi:hypothetical protein